MRNKLRKLPMLIAAAALAGGLTPAFAVDLHPGPGPDPHKIKCNAGRGNGSELVGGVDCDPGNSGTNNNGGD